MFYALQEGDTAQCGAQSASGVAGYTVFALCTAESASKARYTFASDGALYNCPTALQTDVEGVSYTTCVLEPESPKRLFQFIASGVPALDVEFDTTSGTFHFPWP